MSCFVMEGRAASDEKSLPYAGEIQQVEGRLRWREGEIQWLSADFESLGEFAKSDLRLLRADYGRLTSTCEESLAAYHRTDLDTARQLARETEIMKPDRDWRRRFTARQRQAQLWPPEDWVYDIETRWGGARARASAPHWVKVRRQAALAWARVAEAIAPGAEDPAIAALEDDACAAEAEIQIAEAIWRLQETLDNRVPNPKIHAPELDQTIRAFEQLGDLMAVISRDRAEVERRQRAWNRLRQKLDEELDRTYKDAVQAQEAARQAAEKGK